jgi:D-alanine-D-alanine ligase-like ATP-grasp enzyme
MNLGILAMLVVVAGILASFASFVIYLIKRARLADELPSGDAAPTALERADPQEGTAQC